MSMQINLQYYSVSTISILLPLSFYQFACTTFASFLFVYAVRQNHQKSPEATQFSVVGHHARRGLR